MWHVCVSHVQVIFRKRATNSSTSHRIRHADMWHVCVSHLCMHSACALQVYTRIAYVCETYVWNMCAHRITYGIHIGHMHITNFIFVAYLCIHTHRTCVYFARNACALDVYPNAKHTHMPYACRICVYVTFVYTLYVYPRIAYVCEMYVRNMCVQRMPCGTGWRRLTGCLKLQVIFRKRATNSRALLYVWKMCVQHMPCGTGWRRLTGRLKLQVIFRKRATNSRALLYVWNMCVQRMPCGIHIAHTHIAYGWYVCISHLRFICVYTHIAYVSLSHLWLICVYTRIACVCISHLWHICVYTHVKRVFHICGIFVYTRASHKCVFHICRLFVCTHTSHMCVFRAICVRSRCVSKCDTHTYAICVSHVCVCHTCVCSMRVLYMYTRASHMCVFHICGLFVYTRTSHKCVFPARYACTLSVYPNVKYTHMPYARIHKDATNVKYTHVRHACALYVYRVAKTHRMP